MNWPCLVFWFVFSAWSSLIVPRLVIIHWDPKSNGETKRVYLLVINKSVKVALPQGGLEGLPILLCAVSVSPFATYPITFLCGAEFSRISTWIFLLEFGAIEPKK